LGIAQQHHKSGAMWRQKQTRPMDDYEFGQWSELLNKRAGLFLPQKRKTFLLTNLNIRMRELNVEHYHDYFNYLLSGKRGVVEWEMLIDRLTVHETRFYRDSVAMEMLRAQFMRDTMKSSGTLRVNVWSLGCATGEEAYSIAMVLDHELAKSERDYYLSVTATDISSASLRAGRKGVYHNNRLSDLPDIYRLKYCEVVDGLHSKVASSLRKRICFSRFNLLNLKNAKFGLMDLIFCQNVLIYFQREQRLGFVNQMMQALRPGGLLVLGAGEITDWKRASLQRAGCPGILAFRRGSSSSGSGE